MEHYDVAAGAELAIELDHVGTQGGGALEGLDGVLEVFRVVALVGDGQGHGLEGRFGASKSRRWPG